MNIYSIDADLNGFQIILPVTYNEKVHESLDFTGKPKQSAWEPMQFYVDNPLGIRGDFFPMINAAAFACSKKVKDEFKRFWELGAELLPIFLDDGTELFIINVTTCINALNTSETEYYYYEDGIRSNRISKYVFHENRFHESSIFKIPNTANTQVLTYSGIKDPVDEFFSSYHNSNLTGLSFSMLYSAVSS